MTMDTSRLTVCADQLGQLATDTAELSAGSGDRAEEIADRIRDVAAELRAIVDKEGDEVEQATLVAVEDETGAPTTDVITPERSATTER